MRLCFTTRDLLWATTLIAIGLGWSLDHRNLVNRDAPVVETIADPVPVDPESFKERQIKWQNEVNDVKNIPYKEMVGSASESFFHIQSDYPFHMVIDPQDNALSGDSLIFKIMKGNKELLSIKGHRKSVFAAENDVLYFVHYPTFASGGIVTAHDFKNGKQLWETELKAIGLVMHSAYSNEVFLVLTPDAIELAGRESAGGYVEVLDRASRQMLAHRLLNVNDIPKRDDYKLQ